MERDKKFKKKKITEQIEDDQNMTVTDDSPSDNPDELIGQSKKKKTGLMQKIKNHKIISAVIIIFIIIALIRIGSFVVGIINPDVEEIAPVSVKVTTAEYTSISSTAPLSGRVAPAEEVAIIPMAQGQVTAVHVKVGDYVSAGTVLFEIDKLQASTTLNQTRESYNVAKTTFDNTSMLYAEGAVSKSSYDNAKMAYVNAKELYTSASDAYNNCNVSSPISGYVTSLNVSVGSMAGTSMAASVANTDTLVIDTTASEYIAGLIKIGDTVDVNIEGLGDKTTSGIITEFAPVPAMGTLTYPITITLDNSNGDLMSGMFAEVHFKAEESKNAICVPSDSVITKNGKDVVVILDENDIPSYSEVSTGIDNGEFVEIKSGLKKGDTVVISGMDFVTEGVAVKVVNNKEK